VLSRRWFAWIRPGEPHRDRCGSGPGTPEALPRRGDLARAYTDVRVRGLRRSPAGPGADVVLFASLL